MIYIQLILLYRQYTASWWKIIGCTFATLDQRSMPAGTSRFQPNRNPKAIGNTQKPHICFWFAIVLLWKISAIGCFLRLAHIIPRRNAHLIRDMLRSVTPVFKLPSGNLEKLWKLAHLLMIYLLNTVIFQFATLNYRRVYGKTQSLIHKPSCLYSIICNTCAIYTIELYVKSPGRVFPR